MNSLRARIVLTLFLSIICVVVMATATLFLARQGHAQKEQRDYAQLVSEAILLISPLFGGDENDRRSHLGSGPVPGQPRPELTNLLQSQLRNAGSDLVVVVTQPTETPHPFVSIKLKSGWLALPIPERHRGEVLYALASWFLLVALGTVCVAVWFAHRITRHLAVLERVAATIDADGVIPRLPETGPAELRATARALNTMTARLKNAAESRMRLVAAAGHDLRTPMTRMRLRAEFLDEEDRSMWLSDLEELDRIADSAIQLVREETQRETSQLVRVDEITSEICQDLAAMKASVTIMKMEAVTISSAPLALTRAVRNLVINAATHGGGAFVTVGLEDNATASIIIEDEGPGIPDQSMSRVFEPFFRVDPARRKFGAGAGLGLAIAKEIVERHGGKLTLQNRSPRGLRQRISFPACFA
ncbi:Signal transduction histidine kinase [Bradyrhizobium lablabi]|uniref:histidine kinase n=1 Tax=Bradyrhizobium lablabi TaxID=722472 RepID=A0A1M6WBC5_9BRAD|nr:ATP-binding protein [Bradyrhizobium lablabi]SHK90938.1 Signal transduction histidine kinase [Bradyrhizobium lablabi]